MLRVPFLDGDARRTHRNLSWFGQEKALRPAGEGEICISLHRGACVGVTSLRERVVSPGLKKEKKKVQDDCLRCPAPVVEPRPPFYRTRGGQGDGGLETMFCRSLFEMTVATCPRNGRPCPGAVMS
jgi:hypothetical protein